MKRFLFTLMVITFLAVPAFFANASGPIKILLVPGHDNVVWGAQYGNIKEADMNLAVATQIYNILKQDKRFEVHITRDANGYTPEFADYFANHQADIISFLANAKLQMQNKISNGTFVQKINPPHHTVSEDIALRLYGFNKWADENNIDAMIHIHFNDYPRSAQRAPGKYTGFAIYFPDGQLINSKNSGQLAADIFTQLKKKYNGSNYKPELGGLVPDQSLIALGSNGTLLSTVRSVLIEYGYIYEKKFRTKSTRLQAYKDMANLTATGIKNYFFPK